MSLYTNIQHSSGKNAINCWVDKYPNIINKRLNKNLILEAVDLVLKNNTFQFDNTWYIQISGTAMGTKMAPTYANLSMGYLEEKTYKLANDTHGANFSNFLQKNWKRFLDDC